MLGLIVKHWQVENRHHLNFRRIPTSQLNVFFFFNLCIAQSRVRKLTIYVPIQGRIEDKTKAQSYFPLQLNEGSNICTFQYAIQLSTKTKTWLTVLHKWMQNTNLKIDSPLRTQQRLTKKKKITKKCDTGHATFCSEQLLWLIQFEEV